MASLAERFHPLGFESISSQLPSQQWLLENNACAVRQHTIAIGIFIAHYGQYYSHMQVPMLWLLHRGTFTLTLISGHL